MKSCPQCQISYPDALEYCPRDGAMLPLSQGHPRSTQALYDALVGSTIDGRYIVEAKLGEGGMGVVYAARHAIIDKRVAIKILKSEAQEDPAAGQRFIQEARSTSRIRHINIVDITDFGMLVDGSAYFVMEFLEGKSLGQAIRSGPLAPSRVVHIASQIASGLHAAHQSGVIHRDLKPENIFLLERDGVKDFVKIVDFGIAQTQEPGLGGRVGPRLTQAGMVLGTPEYMSPEQATGKEIDHRVDQYSLGCIMFEMLTGSAPYRADTSAGTLAKHVFDPIVSPRERRPDLAIPAHLDRLVVKAMAKDRNARFPSMKELVDALEAVAGEITSAVGVPAKLTEAESDYVPTRVVSTLENESVSAFLQRIPRLVRVGAVTALVILLVGSTAAWFVRRSSRLSATTPADPATELAAPAPSTTPSASKAAAPTTVRLSLSSTPSGASVYLDGTLLGQSPLTAVLPLREEPVDIMFRKSGFQEHTEKIFPRRVQDGEVLEVALNAIEELGERSRARNAHSTSGTPEKKKPHFPRTNLHDPFEER